MAIKKGLGRGIEALFEDSGDTKDVTSGITELKISQVEPNRNQPRKDFDKDALAELASSIETHGVISPIIVRPSDNGQYQIIAGERRWRASKMAGLKTIPAIVTSYDDATTMEVALIENLQREDLNPVEEALGYENLAKAYDLTQDEIAKKVGKSRPAVANAMRLLSLPSSVLAYVKNGALSAILRILGIGQHLPAGRGFAYLSIGMQIHGMGSVSDGSGSIGKGFLFLQRRLLGCKLQEGIDLQCAILRSSVFNFIDDRGSIGAPVDAESASDRNTSDLICPYRNTVIGKAAQIAVAIFRFGSSRKLLRGKEHLPPGSMQCLPQPVNQCDPLIGGFYRRHQNALVAPRYRVCRRHGGISAQSVGQQNRPFLPAGKCFHVLFTKNIVHTCPCLPGFFRQTFPELI